MARGNARRQNDHRGPVGRPPRAWCKLVKPIVDGTRTHDAVLHFQRNKKCAISQRMNIYAPQTKIWEGRANIRGRIFNALFKGTLQRFIAQIEQCKRSTHTLAKRFTWKRILKGWYKTWEPGDFCGLPNDDSGRMNKR
jgi:hypothetical protein